MLSNRNNLLTADFHPNNSSELIQGQRSNIRRSKVLKTKSSNLEFHELSTNSFHQQKIKRNLDRQSPILIQRHRHLSLHQQPSDINQSRNKSLHSRPLNYSKTMNENTLKKISKFSHSLHTPIWTPILTEKELIPSRSSRLKSHSLRHYNTQHYYQSQIEKKNSISSRSMNNDLEIFKKTNIKDLVDEWDDPKSDVAVLSDDDDSIITNCNTSITTYNPQKSVHFASSAFIPKSNKTNLQRRSYNFCLPAVAEDINDEIY